METDVNIKGCAFMCCPQILSATDVKWRTCAVIFDIHYGVCIKADKQCYRLHNLIIFVNN